MCRSIAEGGRRCSGKGVRAVKSSLSSVSLKDWEANHPELKGLYGWSGERVSEVLSEEEADVKVLLSIATHPDTPPETAEAISEREEFRFVKLANSPESDDELLYALAKIDSLSDVQSAVIENPNVSPEILSLLSGASYWGVRQDVAHHPNTPVEVLEKLSREMSFNGDPDDSWNVRAGVAANQNTPVGVLEALAEDEDVSVREKVAESPKVSVQVLMKLASDEDKYVSEEVFNNPTYRAVRQEIAEELELTDSELPAEWVKKLIDSELAERYPSVV